MYDYFITESRLIKPYFVHSVAGQLFRFHRATQELQPTFRGIQALTASFEPRGRPLASAGASRRRGSQSQQQQQLPLSVTTVRWCFHSLSLLTAILFGAVQFLVTLPSPSSRAGMLAAAGKC